MNSKIKRMLICAMAAGLVATGSSITAIAAEPVWGIMPDGFTFTTESTGLIVTAPGGNSSSHSQAQAEYQTIDLQAYADELFRLTNTEREKAGLGPVEHCDIMDSITTTRATELAMSFSHTRPNGESFRSLVDQTELGTSYTGENAAKVPITSDAAKMMQGWMNSEGHRNTILNPKYTSMGISVHQEGQILYCSQILYK